MWNLLRETRVWVIVSRLSGVAALSYALTHLFFHFCIQKYIAAEVGARRLVILAFRCDCTLSVEFVKKERKHYDIFILLQKKNTTCFVCYLPHAACGIMLLHTVFGGRSPRKVLLCSYCELVLISVTKKNMLNIPNLILFFEYFIQI